MKYLPPDNIPLRSNLHDARVGILGLRAIRRERQQVLPVDGSPIGELPGDIKVALRIGYGTDDVVPVLARRLQAGIGFHPVEVLGVGGEGSEGECRQQDEESQWLSIASRRVANGVWPSGEQKGFDDVVCHFGGVFDD